MKKYLLDTNICIYFLKGQFDLYDKIKKIGEDNCVLSEVTRNISDFDRMDGIQIENWTAGNLS